MPDELILFEKMQQVHGSREKLAGGTPGTGFRVS